MFKFIQKQVDINLIKTSMVFALLYCLLFNSPVIIYKFDYYQGSTIRGIFELSKQFIYIYITLLVCFFGLSIHRIVFVIGAILLFASGAVASYYLFFFEIAPTARMMPVIFGAETTEIYELVSARIIVWVIFCLSICIYSIKYFNIQTPSTFVTRFLSAICLFLMVNNIISPTFRVLNTYFPIQYLHNSYVYFFGHSEEQVREDISTKFKFSSGNNEEVVGVLVIGEAARYSNFGINGYGRNTTPRLANISNLISLKGRSCGTTTFDSVPCMLSRYGEKDLELTRKETGVLSILTSLGYDTTWISTQSLTKYYRNNKDNTIYDEVRFHMIPGGSVLFTLNSHDGLMLPHIEKRVQKNGKNFLVIQMTGSHWNYSERYPNEFEKFKPVPTKYTKVDPSSCGKEELVNSYDNSILYTDYFLVSVIDLLKDKNAFLIYVSDHAESLGEEGRRGHGAEVAPEQREIPLMIWLSDNFKQNHPGYESSIKTHQKYIISHDYIFHSILDCLGIKSEIVDSSLSLFKPRKQTSKIASLSNI